MKEIIIGNIAYAIVIIGMFVVVVMDYKRYKKEKIKSQKEKVLFNKFWNHYFENGGMF